MAISHAMVMLVSMGNKEQIAVPSFLKEWRKHRGLTQPQLAEMAGMEAASISQIESGKQWFSAASITRIAQALRCSPVELLAHDPTDTDSFWPLFQMAENLPAQQRLRVRRIIQAALEPIEAGRE